MLKKLEGLINAEEVGGSYGSLRCLMDRRSYKDFQSINRQHCHH